LASAASLSFAIVGFADINATHSEVASASSAVAVSWQPLTTMPSIHSARPNHWPRQSCCSDQVSVESGHRTTSVRHPRASTVSMEGQPAVCCVRAPRCIARTS
jgi:hypothetical protein